MRETKGFGFLLVRVKKNLAALSPLLIKLNRQNTFYSYSVLYK